VTKLIHQTYSIVLDYYMASEHVILIFSSTTGWRSNVLTGCCLSAGTVTQKAAVDFHEIWQTGRLLTEIDLVIQNKTMPLGIQASIFVACPKPG